MVGLSLMVVSVSPSSPHLPATGLLSASPLYEAIHLNVPTAPVANETGPYVPLPFTATALLVKAGLLSQVGSLGPYARKTMFPPAPEVAPARVALSLIVPPTTTPVWLAAVVIVGLFLSLVFVNVQVTFSFGWTVDRGLAWVKVDRLGRTSSRTSRSAPSRSSPPR